MRFRSEPAAGPRGRELDPERLGDHLDRLFRAAWALTGSREEAEDLVQETYARVLARPRFVRHDDDLGYLLRVMRNTCISRWRAAGRRPHEVELVDEGAHVPDPRASDPVARAEAGEVLAAVAALPDAYREVIAAVDLAGLSYGEAARALGVPEGTVMSRLFRARRRVAQSFT